MFSSLSSNCCVVADRNRRLIVDWEGIGMSMSLGQFTRLHAHDVGRSWITAHKNTPTISAGLYNPRPRLLSSPCASVYSSFQSFLFHKLSPCKNLRDNYRGRNSFQLIVASSCIMLLWERGRGEGIVFLYARIDCLFYISLSRLAGLNIIQPPTVRSGRGARHRIGNAFQRIARFDTLQSFSGLLSVLF